LNHSSATAMKFKNYLTRETTHHI